MPYQSIQPCPFGQAYVTFNQVSDGDFMINHGSHQFGATHISFVPHNKAWNNRTTVYTHEAWIMMIGLNLDLWNYSLVEKEVLQFGKLMVWEEDHSRQARTLVKVRVTGLDAVPWFLNFSEAEEPESDSWTVQCEIILIRMLGAQPQDEDFPPDDLDDVDPNNFDFFGFGQPGNGPAAPPNDPTPFNVPNQQEGPLNADLGNQDWAPWNVPVGPDAAHQVDPV